MWDCASSQIPDRTRCPSPGSRPSAARRILIDARWTKKHGKSYFGYKVSANADKRYKLIRKIKVSTASEHDATHVIEGGISSARGANAAEISGYSRCPQVVAHGEQGWIQQRADGLEVLQTVK